MNDQKKEREFIPKEEAMSQISQFLAAADIAGIFHFKIIAKCEKSKRSLQWGDGRKYAIRIR